MTVQFIRNTHENGRFRHFSPEALSFCRQHGSVIGAVLRPETPLTFPELIVACHEYAFEYITDGPHPETISGYVAWVLVHLMHYGMVATVQDSPAPPAPGFNWLAVYPHLAEIIQESM
jgi:hypothetical protein